MSKSSPITITSEELRERVEEYLDRWIPDDVWNRSEPYARRKLDLCRERRSNTTTTSTSYCWQRTPSERRSSATSPSRTAPRRWQPELRAERRKQWQQ